MPVAVGVTALGAGGAFGLLPASAQDQLPARSAAQLLVDVQNADVVGLSGTVVQRADLGLPQLPLPGGQGSSDLTSLISGNHTLRLWYAGPGKARAALLGTLGESDVIVNGPDVWVWSSKTRSATHQKLDRGGRSGASGRAPTSSASALPLTPQQAADKALAGIDPTTEVTTDGTATVAGRAAYELVLTPRQSDSLVGQVRIAVDAQHHVPLRLQVTARGQSAPAIEVGFTQVSFTRPADSQFTFVPPPGTTVTQRSGLDAAKADPGKAAPGTAPSTRKGRDAGGPTTFGTGWSTVVGVRLPAGGVSALGSGSSTGSSTGGSAADGAASGVGRGLSLDRLLKALPTVNGTWGSGRLLSAHLFSVLLTDDGRVYAGAVTPDLLYRAAAKPLPAASTS